jgi:hypothetical protein
VLPIASKCSPPIRKVYAVILILKNNFLIASCARGAMLRACNFILKRASYG